MKRLSYMAGPVVVAIVTFACLFAFFGGPSEDRALSAPSPADAETSTETNAVLAVEQDGRIAAVLWLLSRDERGLVIGMPATTLLKTTPGGFKTISDLLVLEPYSTVADALSKASGAKPGQYYAIDWAKLRAKAGVRPKGSELLPETDEGAAEAAQTLAFLFGQGQLADAAGWRALAPTEETDKTADSASLAALIADSTGTWADALLPGKLVEGIDQGRGYEFYEPDMDALKEMLSGRTVARVIAVEVQNGSGLVGAAEDAAALLEPLGYTLLPVSNSPDFPNVEYTQIISAFDSIGEAVRMRNLFATGTIERDIDLESGHLVVVVGKDFPLTAAEQ